MKKRLSRIFAFALSAGVMVSCSDALDTIPQSSVDAELLITDATSAQTALIGMYNLMQQADHFALNSVVTSDLLSDNLNHIGTFDTWRQIGGNGALSSNVTIANNWRELYETIFAANQIIKVVNSIEDPAVVAIASDVEGQARFIRAINYFYLVRMFGDVPLLTEPGAGVSNEDTNIPRNSVGDVFAQIEADLVFAKDNITNSDPKSANLGTLVATAPGALMVLTKVYAHWPDGERSQDILDLFTEYETIYGADYYDLVPVYESLYGEMGFANEESIFQVNFTSQDGNSLAFWFRSTNGGRHEFQPSEELVSMYDTADARLATNIVTGTNGYECNKYRDNGGGADKPYVMRYADALLIKASAMANTGDFVGASEALNRVRTRAGVSSIVLTAANFEQAILDERQRELAFEGDRWFDLKRVGQAQKVLGVEDCRLLLPIPQREVNVNAALSQNPCY